MRLGASPLPPGNRAHPHLRLLRLIHQHSPPLSQSVMTVTAPVPVFRLPRVMLGAFVLGGPQRPPPAREIAGSSIDVILSVADRFANANRSAESKDPWRRR